MNLNEAYYYLYYIIYKFWSKNYSPLLSNSFKADVCMMALKIWFLISIYSYLSIFMGKKIKVSITEPLGLIPVILIIGSTLYFFTFSNKRNLYFEKFDKMPKRKNQIGRIIVWSIVIFICVNFILSVNIMKSIFG